MPKSWVGRWDFSLGQRFEVNAAHMRNVPGRKTDVQDCAWIAQLAFMVNLSSFD
jgi:hypothetical protein